MIAQGGLPRNNDPARRAADAAGDGRPGGSRVTRFDMEIPVPAGYTGRVRVLQEAR